MKEIFIIRGISGSGKSTLSRILSRNMDINTFEADKYFVGSDGVYRFDPSKLKDAHGSCRDGFMRAVKAGVSPIVVSNTACSKWEFEDYKKIGEQNGYRVSVVEVENWHGNKDVHNVPDFAKKSQAKKLLLSKVRMLKERGLLPSPQELQELLKDYLP